MTLVMPASELQLVQLVYDFLRDSGHLDHGAWSQTLGDPQGVITCACGAILRPFPAGPGCTCIRGNDPAIVTTSVANCPACGDPGHNWEPAP